MLISEYTTKQLLDMATSDEPSEFTSQEILEEIAQRVEEEDPNLNGFIRPTRPPL